MDIIKSNSIEDKGDVGLIKKVNSIIIILLLTVFLATNVEADNLPGEMKQFVGDWVQAWQKGDMESYKTFYASSFKSREKSTDNFFKEKKKLHDQNKNIWIAVQDIRLTERNNGKAKLQFRQHYISSDYSDLGIKKLYLKKIDGRWKIINEEYEPIKENLQYSVQLIPFQDLDKAKKLVRGIGINDSNPYIIRDVSYNGKKVNIVRLGDFTGKKPAEQLLARFKNKNEHYAYITKVDTISMLNGTGKGEQKDDVADNNSSGGSDKYGVHMYPFESRERALQAWSEYKHRDIADKINYVLIEKNSKEGLFGLYACGLQKEDAQRLVDDLGKNRKKAEKILMDNVPVDEEKIKYSVDNQSAIWLDDSGLAEKSNLDSHIQDKQLAFIYARGEGGPSLGTQSPADEKSEEGDEGPSIGGSGPTDSTLETLQDKLQELRDKVDSLQREEKAREALRISEDEREKREEQLLEAAGREYTLLPMGTLGLEFNWSYSYYSHDIITSLRENVQVEHEANHNINNRLILDYALLDNFTFKVRVPFVYKYNEVGTDESKDVTDLGDVSLGVKMQPIKSGGWFPAPIISATLTTPTGRGQYDINPNTELATGSSYYTASGGLSLNKPIDPVNLFASFNYSYRYLQEDIYQRREQGRVLTDVDPGDSLSGSLGFGYALSYKVSLSMSYSYNYSFENKYEWQDGRKTSSGDSVSSNFNISTGLNLTPTQRVILGIGMGLTDDGSDFNVSFRWPFQYELI